MVFAPVFSNDFVMWAFVVLGVLIVGGIAGAAWIVKLLLRFIERL